MTYGQHNEKWGGFYLAHDMCNLPIGTKILQNPPHVTQSPPAEVEATRLPEIDELLSSLAGDTEPITLRSIGQAFFGSRKEPKLVTRFDKPEALDQFHRRLVYGLAKAGCEFIGLDYALDNYQPHTEALLLDPGEIFTMDNLTLFTERRIPQLKSLDEITSRYEFAR